MGVQGGANISHPLDLAWRTRLTGDAAAEHGLAAVANRPLCARPAANSLGRYAAETLGLLTGLQTRR
jgi:hypothetical protein